uniref:Hexosyltransferase n=1 Tax=Panagrolaimus davidi TaxID=227884 RepID=A0A914PVZ7_9BILA
METEQKFRVELKDVNISFNYFGYGIENSCNEKHFVLIATLSRPNAFNLRKSIRDSWKKDIPSSITHKFFIGSVSDESLRQSLIKESWLFGDIVFTSIQDAYLNLTLKMNALYQWQQNYCPKVSYLLRADEDTVLDVKRFEYFLYEKFNPLSYVLNDMAIFGHLFHKNPVLRNPNEKWYVPYEGYNETYYPEYVQGPCYLISSKAIKAILIEAKNHKHITVDDAFYMGIVREKAEISVIDANKHFGYENPILRNEWECDTDGRPFLFNVCDKNGEIEEVPNGYKKTLKTLKELKCDK